MTGFRSRKDGSHYPIHSGTPIYPKTDVPALRGAYQTDYRIWSIKFPYQKNYLFFGPESEAKEFAESIKKEKKYSYSPSIKEITNKI